MQYKKLKRTYKQGYLEYIPRLREVFPEFSSAELAQRFKKLDLEFYHEEKKTTPFWKRLTLPPSNTNHSTNVHPFPNKLHPTW